MSDTESPLAVFRREYFAPIDEYLAWHDGYQANFACLDALTPTERAQATTELLAALQAGTADARVLLGLGHLRCAAALPLLHEALRQQRYSSYALEALASISPAALPQALVAAQLVPQTPTHQLIDLLVGLREHFTLPQLGPAIPPRIFALLTSRDFLVRCHALDTLRRLYGLQTAEQQRNNDPEAIRQDELFGLIARKGWFVTYGRAQRLFLSQLSSAQRLTLVSN